MGCWSGLQRYWKKGGIDLRVLFLSPHTDDVELGAGGTLCKFIKRSEDVYWVVFSTAEDSLPAGMPKDTLKKEFLSVISQAGLEEDNCRIYDFKVRYLSEHRQEILDDLVKLKKDLGPDLVIGPSLNDHHQDHQVVANEMVRAFKNSSSIISYELPWNHVFFNTQLFVPLEKEQMDNKIKFLRNYRSQIAIDKPYFTDEYILGWGRTPSSRRPSR
jgi:LmbE family N-acetylglucosaminyl deacetylase